MATFPTSAAASAVDIQAADELVRGVATAGITFIVVLAAAVTIGLVLLFRRREGAKPTSASGLDQVETRAGVALVHADQALSGSDDELGFAVAQFGETATATADFAAAIADARGTLTRAFRLKQLLDDAEPESPQKRREYALQIIALCETAQSTLDAQNHDFSAMRSTEANAPAAVTSLRTRIAAATARLTSTESTLQRLLATYEPTLDSAYSTAIGDARRELAAASAATDTAESGISPAGVNTVATDLAEAERALHDAIRSLDSVDNAAVRLDDAAHALAKLVESSTADLAEARVQRDAAPDADTGAAIIDAIDDIERTLADVAATKALNPVADLDRLGAAVASLDTALASARNQAQRLEHARIALEGTLVSARSQVAVVHALTREGRRVGADARTRLAEAERQLTLAEAEADPVEALDAARRAVTHARDADALARYDGAR